MPADSLTLYVDSQFASPYALSAFVALQEKRLPFELRTLDLAAREHYAAAYATISLTGRVPTLVHDGFSLSESSAIAEYLEERFPPPQHAAILPRDLRARAQARQVQAWLRSDFVSIRQERPTEVIFRKPTGTPLSVDAQTAARKLFFAADALLADGAENLFGTWCIADTDLALMLNRLVANGDPVPRKLAAYAQQQWQRPAVRRWLDQERRF